MNRSIKPIAQQLLLTSEEASEKIWDVLVIGGGATGLTTALELSRISDKSVAIVSLGEPTSTNHLSFRMNRQGDHRARKFWTSSNENYHPTPGLNGHIGGRSICWHGVVLRLDGTTLEKWPVEMRSKLIGVDCLYSHYEKLLTTWKGSPLSEPTCDYENSLLVSMESEDWKLVPQASKSAFEDGERRWSVYSPLYAWQQPRCNHADGNSLPKIFWGALTEKIRFHDDKSIFEADCNHISNGFLRVRAKELVLAAGTLESTRLYASLVSCGSPQVFPNLNDHFVHGIIVRLPRSIKKSFEFGNRAFLMRTNENLRANLFFEIHADWKGTPILDIWWKSEQARNASSRIIVEEIAGNWSAICESGFSAEDLDRISRQREIISEELNKLNVKPPLIRHISFAEAIESISKGSNGEFYINKLGTADHEAGTLPYGDIFSEFGQSKTLPGLFLASPAGFPQSGYANPTLTSLSVAKMVAEQIAK